MFNYAQRVRNTYRGVGKTAPDRLAVEEGSSVVGRAPSGTTKGRVNDDGQSIDVW